MKVAIPLLFMVISGAAYAQTFRGQSEFSGSYGIGSFQEIMQSSFGFGGGSGYTSVDNATGNLFINYRYYLSNRIAVGIVVGKEQFSTSSFDDYYNSNGGPYRKATYNYTTVATEFLVNYLNKRWVRLYTYFGSGCSFYKVNSSEYDVANIGWVSTGSGDHVGFNLQYVPVAVSVGGMLSGFFELGMGYKGFVNGGLSFRFPYHRPVKNFKYVKQRY